MSAVEDMRESAATVADKERAAARRVCAEAERGRDELGRSLAVVAASTARDIAWAIRALPTTLPDPAAEALHAAAPDLYEALVGVVDIHDNETSVTAHKSAEQLARHNEIWERARKALKKAVAGVPDREKCK